MSQNLSLKICSRCKCTEPQIHFEKNRKICNRCRGDLQKYRANFPEENARRTRDWIKQNPEKARETQRRANLKRTYGITVEQYDELLEKQNHACAVCKRPTSDFPRRLAVDHNHKEGFIRGLLCTNCNHRVVGRYRDSALLRAAADYLDNYRTEWIIPPKKKRKKSVRRRPK